MGRFGPKGGRKAKPPSFGQSRVKNQDTSTPGLPSCPAALSEAAKTVFRTTVRELASTPQWLQRADRLVLMELAVHTVRWKDANKHRDQEGDVLVIRDKNGLVIGQKLSEFVHISQKEADIIMKLSDRLGMNPASRTTSHVEPPRVQGLYDPLMPPRSNFEHMKLERTLSLTETLVQQDPEDDMNLFDPVVDVLPESVVPLVIEPVVPVVESPAAAGVAEPEPVAAVEPELAAESDPTGVFFAGAQVPVEAVAEAAVKKQTVHWPFPRFP